MFSQRTMREKRALNCSSYKVLLGGEWREPGINRNFPSAHFWQKRNTDTPKTKNHKEFLVDTYQENIIHFQYNSEMLDKPIRWTITEENHLFKWNDHRLLLLQDFIMSCCHCPCLFHTPASPNLTFSPLPLTHEERKRGLGWFQSLKGFS